MGSFVLAAIIILTVGAALITKVYFLGKRTQTRKGYILLPCTKSTCDLERTVKGYYWEEIFENENYGRVILIVLLEKSENMYIAKRLEQEYSIVRCVDITDLTDFLKKNELKCYDRK